MSIPKKNATTPAAAERELADMGADGTAESIAAAESTVLELRQREQDYHEETSMLRSALRRLRVEIRRALREVDRQESLSLWRRFLEERAASAEEGTEGRSLDEGPRSLDFALNQHGRRCGAAVRRRDDAARKLLKSDGTPVDNDSVQTNPTTLSGGELP